MIFFFYMNIYIYDLSHKLLFDFSRKNLKKKKTKSRKRERDNVRGLISRSNSYSFTNLINQLFNL